jgi:hypothetical protein
MARPRTKARQGMSNVDAAHALEVSEAYIAVRIRKGSLRTFEDGSIDPEQVHEEAARKQAKRDGGQRDWANELKREQYRKARLERMELQRKLVRREVVERAQADLAVMVRDKLRQVPAKLAAKLAAETDSRACRSMLAKAIDKALVELQEPDDAE